MADNPQQEKAVGSATHHADESAPHAADGGAAIGAFVADDFFPGFEAHESVPEAVPSPTAPVVDDGVPTANRTQSDAPKPSTEAPPVTPETNAIVVPSEEKDEGLVDPSEGNTTEIIWRRGLQSVAQRARAAAKHGVKERRAAKARTSSAAQHDAKDSDEAYDDGSIGLLSLFLSQETYDAIANLDFVAVGTYMATRIARVGRLGMAEALALIGDAFEDSETMANAMADASLLMRARGMVVGGIHSGLRLVLPLGGAEAPSASNPAVGITAHTLRTPKYDAMLCRLAALIILPTLVTNASYVSLSDSPFVKREVLDVLGPHNASGLLPNGETANRTEGEGAESNNWNATTLSYCHAAADWGSLPTTPLPTFLEAASMFNSDIVNGLFGSAIGNALTPTWVSENFFAAWRAVVAVGTVVDETVCASLMPSPITQNAGGENGTSNSSFANESNEHSTEDGLNGDGPVNGALAAVHNVRRFLCGNVFGRELKGNCQRSGSGNPFCEDDRYEDGSPRNYFTERGVHVVVSPLAKGIIIAASILVWILTYVSYRFSRHIMRIFDKLERVATDQRKDIVRIKKQRRRAAAAAAAASQQQQNRQQQGDQNRDRSAYVPSMSQPSAYTNSTTSSGGGGTNSRQYSRQMLAAHALAVGGTTTPSKSAATLPSPSVISTKSRVSGGGISGAPTPMLPAISGATPVTDHLSPAPASMGAERGDQSGLATPALRPANGGMATGGNNNTNNAASSAVPSLSFGGAPIITLGQPSRRVVSGMQSPIVRAQQPSGMATPSDVSSIFFRPPATPTTGNMNFSGSGDPSIGDVTRGGSIATSGALHYSPAPSAPTAVGVGANKQLQGSMSSVQFGNKPHNGQGSRVGTVLSGGVIDVPMNDSATSEQDGKASRGLSTFLDEEE